jgi:hypothetical protein
MTKGVLIMRATTLISTLAISASLIAGGIMLAPAFAQNASFSGTPASTQSGTPWLSMIEVLERLETAGYRDFEEIERERDGYEIKATDANGQRMEIFVDPVTAEVLKTKIKSDKRR